MMGNNLEKMKLLFLQRMKERNLREATMEKASQVLQTLFSFLSNISVTDVREVRREHLQQFQENLAKMFRKKKDKEGKSVSISLRTRYATLGETKRFFRFLETSGRILVSPAAELEFRYEKQNFPKDVLTEEEARFLLDVPQKSKHHILHQAILEILYGSGIRSAELRSLRLADIDLENGFLFISGKGGKDRLVPMTDAAVKVLREYISGERTLMLSKNPLESQLFLMENGQPLKKWYLGRMISRYAGEAGIEKTVTPHTLRHTCATHLLARGASLRYVQELLGHSWISTTEIYTHVLPKGLQMVYEATHPRCVGVKRGRPASGKPSGGRRKKG